ncbi:uncharacterized protein LOC129599614 [Paramacrobiotus metropolitanus]|uniref:uncharacterized protein LOC129599614 n=1 Tax=Paramacrobiotus metropolitanus TaxID=2943436 RepID=UPI0024458CAC|nr:uncharacterized protein LOC129599614 [Paramacrobiotus metropolitanus]
MHFYENTARSVLAWNSTDVEIDGQLQHGYVVGLEEDHGAPPRLYIDFGCPSQQAVLVPYEKTWDCFRHVFNCPRMGGAVEVLLHEGPQRPWKWYPGKLLISSFKQLQHVAWVEVLMDGKCFRELVPQRQIRQTPGEAVKPGRLPADHFVMQTCKVPNGYWALPPSLSAFLLRQVEQELGVRCFKVLSQKMLVLRFSHKILEDEHLETVFERAKTKHELCHALPAENGESNVDLKRKKQLTVSRHGMALPFEVLKEIFLSLDTVDRLRCRRTCQLWETFLTSAEVGRDLRLARQRFHSSSACEPMLWTYNYAMYACILKHITPATRVICIRDTEPFYFRNWNRPNDADEAVEMISKVLEDAGRRIDCFVLDRRSINIDYSAFNQWKLGLLTAEIEGLQSRLGSCSDRLILKDYALTLLDKKGLPVMVSRIPIAVFQPGQAGAVPILDLLEKHLCCKGPPLDVQRIADYMASGIDSEEKAKILRKYQTTDPRSSLHYRGNKWTLHNVADVDVSKLNRFCLHALAKCAQENNGQAMQFSFRREPSSSSSESSNSESEDGQD